MAMQQGLTGWYYNNLDGIGLPTIQQDFARDNLLINWEQG